MILVATLILAGDTTAFEPLSNSTVSPGGRGPGNYTTINKSNEAKDRNLLQRLSRHVRNNPREKASHSSEM